MRACRSPLAKTAGPCPGIRCGTCSIWSGAAPGVSLPTIKALMGHADIQTTLRYVTVGEGQLDAAIERAFGTPGQQVGNETGKPG